MGNRAIETCAIGDASFQYYLEEGAAHIVKCSTRADDVQIPAVLGRHPVVGLNDSSFANLTKARKVTCPESLRSIGKRAFEGCMHLADIRFNDGLEWIGEEAFFLCASLSSLDLPASIKHIGVNLTGWRGSAWAKPASVRIADSSPHLLYDDAGVLYESAPEGLVLVDGSGFAGEELVCDARTVRVGERSLAQHPTLRRVVLPVGVRSIGQAAFRGCTALVEVHLPPMLESIGEAAFSCTRVKEIHLSAACTNLHPRALVQGPVVEGSDLREYHSHLRRITVDPANPRYVVAGGVLCERLSGGGLKTMLCPNDVGEVVLGANVVCVGEGTFSGAAHIGTLRLRDGLAVEGAAGLLPHNRCSRLVLDVPGKGNAGESLVLEVPSGKAGCDALSQGLSGTAIDARRLLQSYDLSLSHVEDRLEQARLMCARLARPVFLSPERRSAFTDAVRGGLDNICLHFGARSYWQGLEQLVDAGMLDGPGITRMVGLLSRVNDAPAIGFLLNLKRERFGEAAWDYDL